MRTQSTPRETLRTYLLEALGQFSIYPGDLSAPFDLDRLLARAVKGSGEAAPVTAKEPVPKVKARVEKPKCKRREPMELWPEIMSYRTAAAYMDRSYDVVWEKADAQEIPVVEDRGRKFLRKCDIDAWAVKRLI